MLRDAGYDFTQIDPPFSDPPQAPSSQAIGPADDSADMDATGPSAHQVQGDDGPSTLAMGLARQKAISLLHAMYGRDAPTIDASTLLPPDQPCIILAADTICISTSGQLLGQPQDRAEAAAMIRSFTNASHHVVTGLCLIRIDPPAHTNPQHAAPGMLAMTCLADTATVHFGELSDTLLNAYLDTDQWQGKAGGYNLFDRQRDYWPIEVSGDPTTVVGLPMQKFIQALEELATMKVNHDAENA